MVLSFGSIYGSKVVMIEEALEIVRVGVGKQVQEEMEGKRGSTGGRLDVSVSKAVKSGG